MHTDTVTASPAPRFAHPAHYQSARDHTAAANVEVWDVIECYGLEDSFCLANVCKYLLRAGAKGEPVSRELRKALDYITRYAHNAHCRSTAEPMAIEACADWYEPDEIARLFGLTGARSKALRALLSWARYGLEVDPDPDGVVASEPGYIAGCIQLAIEEALAAEIGEAVGGQ